MDDFNWFCETYQCKMSKDACLTRRQSALNKKSSNGKGMIFRSAGCLTCKQFGDVAMDEQSSSKPEKMQTCSACGVSKNYIRDFRENKKHTWKRIQICKQCEVDPPVKKRKSETPSPIDTAEKEVTSNPMEIKLDFAPYPKLLEAVKSQAVKQYRTVIEQIFYLIDLNI